MHRGLEKEKETFRQIAAEWHLEQRKRMEGFNFEGPKTPQPQDRVELSEPAISREPLPKDPAGEYRDLPGGPLSGINADAYMERRKQMESCQKLKKALLRAFE